MRAEMHLRHLATMVLPLEAFVSPVAAWSLLPRSNVLVTKLYQDGNRSDFVQLLHVRMPGSRMVEFQGQFFMWAFNKGVLQSSSSDSTIWKRDAFGINSSSKFWASWLQLVCFGLLWFLDVLSCPIDVNSSGMFWSYEDCILISPKPQQHRGDVETYKTTNLGKISEETAWDSTCIGQSFFQKYDPNCQISQIMSNRLTNVHITKHAFHATDFKCFGLAVKRQKRNLSKSFRRISCFLYLFVPPKNLRRNGSQTLSLATCGSGIFSRITSLKRPLLATTTWGPPPSPFVGRWLKFN